MAERASLTKAGHVQLSNKIDGTSQILASTEFALNELRNATQNAICFTGDNPNTTEKSLILIDEHPNGPTGAGLWYIETFFYITKQTSGSRSQLARSYDDSGNYGKGLYWRTCYNNVWSLWTKLVDESMKNVPGGYPSLDENGNLPSSVLPNERIKLSTIDLSQGMPSNVNLDNLIDYNDFLLILKEVTGNHAGSTALRITINNLNASNDYVGVYTTVTEGKIANISFASSHQNWSAGSSVSGFAKLCEEHGQINAIGMLHQTLGSNRSATIKTDVMVRNPTVNNVESIQVNTASTTFSSGIIELWGALK